MLLSPQVNEYLYAYRIICEPGANHFQKTMHKIPRTLTDHYWVRKSRITEGNEQIEEI